MPIIHYNTRSTSEALADKVSITYSQFDQIAEEAEKKSKEDYEAYETDLVNFARLGNLYIGGILTILVLAIVFCIQHIHGYGGTKLTLILGILILGIIGSLFVKSQKPEGIELKREQYPKLFSLIDDISSKVNAQADVVLLTDDYNAAVVQIPKAGFFGGSTNYLILGLPFMMAQDDKQFIATVAHEFGHLSNNHSETSRWIYNIHVRWSNLLKNLDEKNILFRPFFAWYIPRLSAKSLVMNRKHELEADQFAIDLAGIEANAQSLVVCDLRAHGYYKASEEVFKLARYSEQPPNDVYLQLQQGMNTIPTHELRKWLLEALEHEGTKGDTHPPLKARLEYGKSLDYYQNISDEELVSLCAPLPTGESSAEIYLGDELKDLIAYMSKTWYESQKEIWAHKHQNLKEMENFLGELNEKSKKEELTLDEMRAKANILSDLSEKELSLAVRHEILQREPNCPFSNYEIGRYLVENKIESHKNVDASNYLLRSCRYNLLLAESAQQIAIQHFSQHKRENEIDGLKALKEEIDQAFKERASIKDTDEFLEHELDNETREILVNWVGQINEIRALHLVRKKMTMFPESHHYIISLNVDGISSEDLPDFGKGILENSHFLGYTRSVFIVDTWNLKLDKKIRAVPNSLIVKRDGKGLVTG
ncbi:MAG: M48 family metalloprotease [Cyanobacteria bacterium TGS_CYA1]|nr:M48 family metalloprotease [Cyanobacteria bacterium TGS_CYA1]